MSLPEQPEPGVVSISGSPDPALRSLSQLLEAAAGAPPLTRVLPQVASTLADVAGMERATVLLYDRRGDLVAGTSRTREGALDARLWSVVRRAAASVPAVSAALRGAPPAVFTSPEAAVALGPDDWVARFEARTVVVAAIRSPQRALGVAVLDDPRRRAVDDRGLETLAAALAAAATVLELLEAVEEERRARARIEQVIETTGAAARSMGIAATMDAVVEGLQLLTNDALVVATVGVGEQARSFWSGDAATARRAVEAFVDAGAVQGLGAATALELRGDRWRRMVQLGFRRALAVPMRHRERDLGWMLSLGATTVGYAEDERRAAALVGEQASLALNTSSLLEAERATVDRLTEIDQLKSTFVAAVSHELRTPLTAILGFAELLAEEIEAPMLVAHLDDLRSEGAVLESLIGNLLDTSRLEAGLLRLNLHPIDLTATLRRAVEVVGHGHPSRDVRMFVVDDAGPVVGDGERLRQVFINLIENAAKYSPASGVIDVTVAAGHDSSGTGWIEVTVDDEGPGIPEGDRLRVFERFRRLAADEASPGTGIGLYVVKAVVEAHGGTVTIEDGPQGWGTRFRVRLPTGR